MPTLTLKNLPRGLHRKLRARAARHRRSLNSEAIACIAAAVMASPLDPDALLSRARSLRRRVSGRLTDQELARAKAEGRP